MEPWSWKQGASRAREAESEVQNQEKDHLEERQSKEEGVIQADSRDEEAFDVHA